MGENVELDMIVLFKTNAQALHHIYNGIPQISEEVQSITCNTTQHWNKLEENRNGSCHKY